MRNLQTRLVWVVSAACLSVVVSGCANTNASSSSAKGPVTKIEAGPDAQKRAQTAFINAKPGSVIEFGEGKFDFSSTLSLDVNNVTVRGAGIDKTILAFDQQQQGTGGEGILVISKKNVTVEDMSVQNAKGDAVKINGCDGLTLRRIRTYWEGGPKETNGGYGLYPVLCTNVLIEECIANDASDAGIYVGQSENIIVRKNRAEHNVAGIEIENSVNADVYENVATNNTGGILVFSLPDLQKKIGHHCRVYNNQIIENNHPNFAPKGTAVAGVPAGTGVMILANRQVEVFDNKIENNQMVGVSICSYLVTNKPYAQDKIYDPYCEAISVHNNKFAGGGTKPDGELGKLLGILTGGKLPDIAYDGVIDEKKAKDGALPTDLAIRIRDNGDATFLNFNLPELDLSSPFNIKKDKISTDLAPYAGEIKKLSPVKIAGVK